MSEQATPPLDYWLKLTEVRARTTLGAGTIYKMIAKGTFPRPAKLGARCVRWRTSWIAEWETTRPGVAEHPRASEVTRVETAVRPPAVVASSPAVSRRQPRFRRHTWEPLTMTWEEVADRVFRRDAVWLRGNLPADFPRPDPEYDLFHVEAVEAWTRRRWGVVSDAGGEEQGRTTAQAILRERLQAKKAAHGRNAAGGRITPGRRPASHGTP